MSQQRETTTDRLINVIEVIQLGRKTGLLTVERGEGKTYEEGSIMFVNGQVTQASSGYRQGQDAFHWLCTWETCRFTLVYQTNPQGPFPQQTPEYLPPPPTGPQQRLFLRPSQPLPGPQTPPFVPDTQPNLFQRRSGTTDGLPRQSTTDSLTRTSRRDSADDYQYQQHLAVPISAIPVRVPYFGDVRARIDETGLSRTHKHLFLLIDDHRTIGDLARLTRRDVQETHRLLRDLEVAGLIRM